MYIFVYLCVRVYKYQKFLLKLYKKGIYGKNTLLAIIQINIYIYKLEIIWRWSTTYMPVEIFIF